MRSLLRGWRSRHLLTAWFAYWTVLLGVALWPAIPAAWQLFRAGDDGHGSVAAGFNDDLLSLTIKSDVATLWSGAVSFGTAVLWIAGPPLLLWLIWLLSRSREATEPVLESGHSAPELGAGSWELNARTQARAPEPEAAKQRRNPHE
ncbi:MAG TPA: hypothetical protein VHQ45_09235 [Gemmatimonadaceae bacterium]|jgi:hypothetical protein|nr:hypothetical protein [Gemmatimonadaceae bacterium]